MFKISEMMRLAHHLKGKSTVQLMALKHKATGVIMDYYNREVGGESYWKAALCCELAEKSLSFRTVTAGDAEDFERWLEEYKQAHKATEKVLSCKIVTAGDAEDFERWLEEYKQAHKATEKVLSCKIVTAGDAEDFERWLEEYK